jgi:hypothetical protein
VTDRSALDRPFRQAAATYVVYGLAYLGGAAWLATQGIGAQGRSGGRAGFGWFVFGALLVLVIPWLVSRGARGRGYRWIVRLLSLLVAYRAFELARIALRPKVDAWPLPGGGTLPPEAGAWAFCLLTALTALMLARAGWSRSA